MKTIQEIYDDLLASSHDKWVLSDAIRPLNDIRDENIAQQTLTFLSDPGILAIQNSEIFETLALVYGRFDNPVFLDPLLALLDSPYWNVRFEAARSLGNHPCELAFSALLEILAIEKDMVIVDGAIRGLGGMKDKRAVPFLIQKLKHPHWDIRDSAAIALGEIGDKTALEALNEALAREGDNTVKEDIQDAIQQLT
jgi:HEAT repeat protein